MPGGSVSEQSLCILIFQTTCVPCPRFFPVGTRCGPPQLTKARRLMDLRIFSPKSCGPYCHPWHGPSSLWAPRKTSRSIATGSQGPEILSPVTSHHAVSPGRYPNLEPRFPIVTCENLPRRKKHSNFVSHLLQ